MSDPITPIVGMKNWNAKKKRWDGVICQVIKKDGKEQVLVLDVMYAEHEVDLDEKIEESIRTKPWLVQ